MTTPKKKTVTNAVDELWKLCGTLRDDGLSYLDYLTELVYILFLKLAHERDQEEILRRGAEERPGDSETVKTEKKTLRDYSWEKYAAKKGNELYDDYRNLLRLLGTYGEGHVGEIFRGAQSTINAPANLKKIFTQIDNLQWYTEDEERFGELYEGLLEKNANEIKSGAGQYFTPRPLIDVMTRLMDPKPGERCNDPACGTFGFMLAANDHVKKKGLLPTAEAEFQQKEAFSGCEITVTAHRLALMNAILHDLEPKIWRGDSLSGLGKEMMGYDLILTNPPFGDKKEGAVAPREELPVKTNNKQFNFLQHIMQSLKDATGGKPGGRAAVVFPDNILFKDGSGTKIRQDLMEHFVLDMVLRLPTGIFYAQGVKTNVLFFQKGAPTEEVWFYDLRTNMPSFGKTNPLKVSDFKNFEAAYTAKDRRALEDERLSVYTREEIKELGDTLDLGLIRDESLIDAANLPKPEELMEEAREHLEEALVLLNDVFDLLPGEGEAR